MLQDRARSFSSGTFLQTLPDASAATLAAKAHWKQRVLADQTAEAEKRTIAREVRDAVALAFRNAPTTREAFLGSSGGWRR